MDAIPKWFLILLCMSLVNLLLLYALVSARPEKIRPGLAYYSDDSVEQGLVCDIVGERNYEEVYRYYHFYEAVYDENRRVRMFREYKQGDIIRTEEYRYDASGKLVERILKRPGAPAEITTLDNTESPSDSYVPSPIPRR